MSGCFHGLASTGGDLRHVELAGLSMNCGRSLAFWIRVQLGVAWPGCSAEMPQALEWEQAMCLFRGVQCPDAITYTTAISACAAASQWQVACSLLLGATFGSGLGVLRGQCRTQDE